MSHMCEGTPFTYRSLLHNVVSFIGLFCKRDLGFMEFILCIPVCVMTVPYMWRDSFIYVTRLVHICNVAATFRTETVYTCDGQLLPHAFTWPIHVCDVFHSYMSEDSFWLRFMCDVTRSYTQRDSFRYVTWLIRTCNMTATSMPKTFTHLTANSYLMHLLDPFMNATCFIHKCDVTYSYVWCDSFIQPRLCQNRLHIWRATRATCISPFGTPTTSVSWRGLDIWDCLRSMLWVWVWVWSRVWEWWWVCCVQVCPEERWTFGHSWCVWLWVWIFVWEWVGFYKCVGGGVCNGGD